ncbi:NAD(P)/FAD-dependent oxidoreductase [Oricola thermophila]|uniref:FAD-binding oxidoreductase n=1 Tax=Oricola thermophila TaxID=2742145 RepID=A0A6N1VGV5_9HYPH|nr:FAD-binding oxidoreductase [Oricola thermophila]QKV20018.1 FAD-binding oxidoreductase [Oricola thermophila]
MYVDTIVLGAGIVGVSAAIHLARRDRSVLLIDIREAGEGTSKGNAGLIQREGVLPHAFPQKIWQILKYGLNTSRDMRYHLRDIPPLIPYLVRYWWHSRPKNYQAIVRDYAQFISHSVSEHALLVEKACAQHLIVRNGWLEAYRSDEALTKAYAEADWLRSEYEIASSRVEAAELRMIEPSLKIDFAGAIRWTDPWTVKNPLELTRAYFAYFRKLGGQYLQGDAHTLTCGPDGRWSVMTCSGVVSARDAVVALGPWSTDLVRMLGYRFPIAVQRGYSIHYRPEEDAPLQNWFADREMAFLLAPMTNGIRLTTGSEFARRDAAKSPVQLDVAEKTARETVRFGERVDTEPWLGARPCTADMLPIIGPAPRHRGLWFAFGHAHHGLTLGPATGRLIAEMIVGEETFTNAEPFSARRFRSL